MHTKSRVTLGLICALPNPTLSNFPVWPWLRSFPLLDLELPKTITKQNKTTTLQVPVLSKMGFLSSENYAVIPDSLGEAMLAPHLPPTPRLGRGDQEEELGGDRDFRGWGGACGGRRSCPSLSVRDELTAQLLFQLHGLFENNVMSFITDNPGKWLLWQPGKRMAPANQSKVLSAVPLCSNSPLGPLPSPTWEKA